MYDTWYKDFSRVRLVTSELMSSFPLGKNITYKPGVRLLKIESVPTVYIVNFTYKGNFFEFSRVVDDKFGKNGKLYIDCIKKMVKQTKV
jgi:hypothetical protein